MFMLIYFAGIAACGIQGAQKAKSNIAHLPHPTIVEFCSAFGGGLIRDIFLLNVYPAAFTVGCIPDIITALVAGTIYLWLQKNKGIHKSLLHLIVVADACGLGTFIAIGADKAISLGASPSTVFLCSVATSIGGGILSALLCNISMSVVLGTNMMYRFVAVIGSILYPLWVKNTGKNVAHVIIIVYTSVAALACNLSVRAYIAKGVLQCSFPLLIDMHWMIIIVIKIPSSHVIRIKCSLKTPCYYTLCSYKKPEKVLAFHRIRQM